jgi:glycerol kinase
MEKYILALDQGTSSSRAILFNMRGQPVARAALQKSGAFPERIVPIGITNQRETMIVWDRRRGLVWDDDLLKTLNIPRSMLPDVHDSSGIVG